jgi:hypothetical protein
MLPRRWSVFAALLFLGIVLLLVAQGCGKKSSTGPTPPATATVSGVVADAGTSAPISGASVKATTGAVATTDASGHFTISVTANQTVQVDVTRSDYTLNQVVLNLGAGETRTLSVSLLEAGTTSSIPVSAGGEVTDTGSGATLTLPAGFVTASGSVNVRVTGLDPTTSEVKALPGGLDAIDADGHAVYLKPVSFAEYTVTDGSGNVLQFNPSASAGAAIELPIPASLRGQPGYLNGDHIECYVYDPADGKCKTPVPGVIGPSSVDGSPAIKATIFHLSWYGGAPASTDIACVEGTVKRDGVPVPNVDIGASPGGTTRTDAQGHYQVQAAANSTVHIEATQVSGATFSSGEGSVAVSAAGGVCAHLDLDLGTPVAGQYTVNAEIAGASFLASGVIDVAVADIEITTKTGSAPVPGAKVEIGTGGTWYTLNDEGSGSYTLSGVFQSFPLSPGADYTIRIDLENNGSFDASGQVKMVGVPVITSPDSAATVGRSFTTSWSDPGTSVSGYSAGYLGVATSKATSRTFVTAQQSFVIGNGVADPVTHLTNDPLPAGAYQLIIQSGNGAYWSALLGGNYTPNITGTNTTGYFWSSGSGKIVPVTSSGVLKALAARGASDARVAPEAAAALERIQAGERHVLEIARRYRGVPSSRMTRR